MNARFQTQSLCRGVLPRLASRQTRRVGHAHFQVGTGIRPKVRIGGLGVSRRAEQSGRATADVLAEQEDRDARDRGRETSPLAPAPDAIPLDTTGLTLPEVVDRIVTLTTQVQTGEAVR